VIIWAITTTTGSIPNPDQAHVLLFILVLPYIGTYVR
jgi:hypothetical protein